MVCGNLERNQPTDRKPSIPRSERLRDWRQSATQGCLYCSIIIDGIKKTYNSWTNQDSDFTMLHEDANLFVSSRPLTVTLDFKTLNGDGSSQPSFDNAREDPMRKVFTWYLQPGKYSQLQSARRYVNVVPQLLLIEHDDRSSIIH